MSETLKKLYEGKAFKPTPSLWEMAEAHVPFAELDVIAAPEESIQNGLTEGDGVAVLIGPSGSGKSSVLAYVAKTLAVTHADGPHVRPYLPVFVPVAGRPQLLN